MHQLSFRRVISLVILFAALFESSFAAVLAIDYGSDWIKASLMKPGVPFDVLLNKDSKRKIQSSVAWKKDDRLFSTDAANIASRFPSDSFSSLKYLQGAPYDSDVVSYFTSISTAEILKSSRGTVALKQSDGTEWNSEELIAMQFAYIKSLADDLGGEPVTDVIVTVPPYYTQFERDAVADAVEVAGLRTLALINDGTAVAINYAMTRTFTVPEYHVIYDAGASSTRATVVSFAPAEEGKGKSSGTQISVLGVGYDRATGGTELDRRLREILIDNFTSKHKRDIRKDKRGMAKLWKEAGRVKAILSANSDAMSTVESVAFDIDFKAKVTRAEFERACLDLQGRFARPIDDALARARLTLSDITSVILTGGASRTPMIQTAVKAAVGEERIALNVNADEAAVLGAALHGAALSRQFKTKDIRVSDIIAHDVQASYFATAPTPSAKPRTISTLIFPEGTKHGTRKTLTFKRKEDFALWLDYKNIVFPGFPKEILEVQISGVAEALGNLTERGAVDPVIKATVTLSESGFVSIKEAVAFGEIKDESLTGRLKNLFGGGSTGEQVPESVPSAEGSAAEPASTVKPPSKDAKDFKDRSTIPLTVSTSFAPVPPMTVAEKKAGREKLRAIDNKEAAKVRKEEARNTLEGYLYRLRDLLDDGPETPFKKCSKASEREVLSKEVKNTISWLHDEGEQADTAQLWGKRTMLELLEKPITHRYKEIEAFPQALNTSQMWNWSTRLFLTEARDNLTAEAKAGVQSRWTKEELDALEVTLKEHEVWLNDGVEKQKKMKMNDDPAITTAEMKTRAKALEQHLQRLVKRKAPKPKKAKTTAETNGSSNAGTDEPTGSNKQPGHDEL
ncbi:actin-like ATPase domain-containing protein [Leucogyrophana mollusca]|uniref:Actin-like ATPase domain-containing protein n=1 Tax=Leucogyrophana mollusca TaxID=85980 RepID=A0ACB8BQQ5_9AGAM|nr:actin-like ATPase domain-containing protein [Leucogyrophana mollusca]